jgi:LDH2 family malate/lactate/ureidoglycolate dehydrogenase
MQINTDTSKSTTGQKVFIENTKNQVFLRFKQIESFILDVMVGLGVPKKDATVIAEILVESDKRGIDSHGIGRLMLYYQRIKRGQINPVTNITVERQTLGTARLNANNGMGHVAAKKGMQIAIEKAKICGIGMVTIGNSNHYGIAGYFSSMASKQGMIGMTGTNARPAIAPTGGVEPMLGTNAFTISVPTDWEFDWVADHATSTTQRGKIETYARLNRNITPGWVVDENGIAITDSKKILDLLVDSKAALTPLGGIGTEMGGHKGYNYATWIEIMSSCLSNANFLKACSGVKNGKYVPYNLGHFFIALDVEAFIDLDEFKKASGDLLRQLAASKKAPGVDHIYIAGEIEYNKYKERLNSGVPITEETQRQILQMQQELELFNYNFDFNVEIKNSELSSW